MVNDKGVGGVTDLPPKNAKLCKMAQAPPQPQGMFQ